MSSEAQLAANRRNSELSTGPKTEAGKAKSSLNAVRHGFTGRTVLLPSDDTAAYEAHLQAFQKRYAPATDEERNLVQSLADTEWRLLRIPSLEMGIYAVGRLELASNFQKIEDPQARAALIEAKVYLTYQRQLNNLSIQEGRLIKQRDKALAELDRLQKLRARLCGTLPRDRPLRAGQSREPHLPACRIWLRIYDWSTRRTARSPQDRPRPPIRHQCRPARQNCGVKRLLCRTARPLT